MLRFHGWIEVRKRRSHYSPANIEDASLNELSFWDDEYNEWTTSKIIDANTIEISWKYNNEVPNEKLRGTTNSRLSTLGNFGRGEWVGKQWKMPSKWR